MKRLGREELPEAFNSFLSLISFTNSTHAAADKTGQCRYVCHDADKRIESGIALMAATIITHCDGKKVSFIKLTEGSIYSLSTGGRLH